MAGVSSESLATALADLETKLPTASLSLADELFGILRIVDASAGLRRAMTDPSRESEDKSALVQRLLAGKASSDAIEIVSRLAQLRWADARNVSDALETLASDLPETTTAATGPGEPAHNPFHQRSVIRRGA